MQRELTLLLRISLLFGYCLASGNNESFNIVPVVEDVLFSVQVVYFVALRHKRSFERCRWLVAFLMLIFMASGAFSN